MDITVTERKRVNEIIHKHNHIDETQRLNIKRHIYVQYIQCMMTQTVVSLTPAVISLYFKS